MKSPMHQRPDSEARDLTEEFIAKHTRKQVGKAAKSAKATAKSEK
jgi:hypothetical protein